MNEKVVRKKSDIGIIRRSVRASKMREGISRSHSGAGDMSKMEVEVLEEHHPACLSVRQLLWLAEIREILMISEENDWVTRALEVMLPMIQGMDNSEEFPVIDIIVAFCRGEGLRKICAGVKVSVVVLLHEDPPTSQEGSISHDNERTTNIQEAEYRDRLKLGE